MNPQADATGVLFRSHRLLLARALAVFASTTILSAAQLTLTWQDNSDDETGFTIERSDNGGAFSQLVTGLAPDTTSYVDTTVTAGVRYQYRVTAYNAIGNSPYSNVATNAPQITTNPSGTTVSAFQNVTLTAAASGVPAPSLQWQKDGVNLTDGTGASGVTISGSTSGTLMLTGVHVADAGSYTLVASNGISPTATSSAAVVVVNKLAQTISAKTTDTIIYAPGTYNSGTTASSGLPITYSSSNSSVATASGSTITIVGAGSTAITITQPGNADYLAAPSVPNLALTVLQSPQSITFSALPRVKVGSGPVTLAATASSGLPISYSQSNAGVAPLSGNTATPTSVGFTVIQADQAGNANYSPAQPITQALFVDPGDQTITFGPLANKLAGDAPFTLTGTASSGLAVTYTSSNLSVATVSGSTVTIVGAGVTTITAAQPGNSNWNAATSVPQSLTVIGAPPAITTQPSSVGPITAPAAATFTVAASGAPTPTFQWQKNVSGTWTNLTNTPPYSGVTTATLTINPTSLALDQSQYRAIASNGSTPATSNAATLTVYTLPSFTTQPASASVLFGAGNATFTAAQTASPTPTIKWQVSTNNGTTWTDLADDATYSGTATTTLTVTSPAITLNSTQYRAVGTNAAGSTASNAATLTVTYPVALTAQPADATVVEGNNALFTVTATGNPGPAYQWQVSIDNGTTWTDLTNTAPYSNVTSAGLSITGVTRTLNGNMYRVKISNVVPSSATSNAATLTVNYGPGITVQPTNKLIVAGGNAVLTVTATGNPGPAYQWQVSTDNGTTWTNVTDNATYQNSTSSGLSILGATAGMNGYKYRVQVSNIVSSVTSAVVTLNTNAVAPTFSTNPANVTVAPTAVATFTAAAAGNPTPTLQWQVSTDNGTTWTNLANGGAYAGVTTGTLTVTPPDTTYNARQYRAMATNSINAVPSSAAVLSVNANAPLFTTQPANASILTSGSATFTVVVTGVPAPTIQWQSSPDGTTWTNLTATAPYSGVTTASLVVTTPSTSLSGTQVRAVATNSVSTATSAAASLTVSNPPPPPPPPPPATAPSITGAPASQTVAAGANVTFTVTASGTTPLSYQWRFNSTAIAGATSASYTRSNVQASDAGTYDVTVSNSAGSANSSATLTIGTAPTITTQPTGATVTAGTSVSFSVTATGTTPLSYQWRKAGTAISGATNATYTIASAQSTDAAAYDVIVSNSVGSVTSNPALLAVNAKSYAGDYFGTLSGGGTWALHVRPDNTGTYIAYLPDRKSAIVVSVTISANGTFSVTGSETTTASTAAVAAGTPPVAAAAATFTLSGAITNGQVSGQLAGIGQTLSGSADTGSSSTAGFYTASALGTSGGTTYTVVGASGHALVVTTTPTTVDSASGTVGSNGQLAAQTAAGAQLALSVNPTAQTLSATYTSAGSAPVTFSGVSDGTTVTTRLINLSARSLAGSGSNTLIAGFVVNGSGTKSLLVRGVGPTLGNYGVTGLLDDPVLGLYSGTTALGTNDDWGTATNASDVATTTSAVGAFSLAANAKDSAVLTSVAPGAYTAQVSGKANASGVALIELYDAAKTADAHLVNVSARTQVGSGANVLIVGFVIDGNAPKQYLIRAVGPTLGTFGVTGVLADPQLSIVAQGATTALQQNDDWAGTAALKAAFASVGAFALPDTSKDAAMVITLNPGAYSAIVSGANGSSGVALIELYELP